MRDNFIFIRVVRTMHLNTTNTPLSDECYMCCRGRRISELFSFYFIIEQYTRDFQWIPFWKVCGIHLYYFNRTRSNRPIPFSLCIHESSWGICLSDDLFDCSREEIRAQCRFHRNNIASFSCCGAIQSKIFNSSFLTDHCRYMSCPYPTHSALTLHQAISTSLDTE